MGPLFHACSPSPGRFGSVCAQVGLVFAGVRLVQARPSFPPLRLSWCSSVGLRFFFSLAFSGFARSGQGVLVLVFSLGSSSPFWRSPSRVPVK